MTRAELNDYIDTNISDKTADNSLSPTDEGNALKEVADYTDQQNNILAPATDGTGTTNHITVGGSISNMVYSATTWAFGNTGYFTGILTVTGTAAAQTFATFSTASLTPASNTFIPISGSGSSVIRVKTDGDIEITSSLTTGTYAFNGTYPIAIPS